MIVDDEPMLREGLAEHFEWSKYQINLVGCSRDGVEALKLFEDARPDIIITDVRMPRMNGIELSRKAKELAPDVQIIFISGFDELNYLRGALKVQAADYLLKPLKLDDLKLVLHEVTVRIDENRTHRMNRIHPEQRLNKSISLLQTKPLQNLLNGAAPAANLSVEDSENKKNYNRIVALIKQSIETKLSAKLTIADLAKEAYMAPNYLSTLFKQETGFTINQYIMKARLDKAIELLTHTNRRIIDIATDVGYPDPAYFTKLFKKYTGLNPSEYRNIPMDN